MSLIRLNTRPSRNALRTFGTLCLALLAVLGAQAWRKGDPGLAMGEWASGALLGGLAAYRPAWLRFAYLAAVYLSFPIGFAASYVILTAVYFLLFTPAGLVLRWCGHDPLSRRWDRTRKTYWERRPGPKPASSYFHQT
jgi:ABC-type uncharacterized transport system permease subunit